MPVRKRGSPESSTTSLTLTPSARVSRVELGDAVAEMDLAALVEDVRDDRGHRLRGRVDDVGRLGRRERTVEARVADGAVEDDGAVAPERELQGRVHTAAVHAQRGLPDALDGVARHAALAGVE